MAIFEGFRATNIWKAFVLNSVVAALIIFIAMMAKEQYDTYKDKHGDIITRTTTGKSAVFTLLITFAASFLAFTAMHFIVGYGRGQLVD